VILQKSLHELCKMSDDHQPEIALPPVDGIFTVPEALNFPCEHSPAGPIITFQH